ncbi:hypothetical protein [Neolewinella persica]|uniref:hypothetical protein n=1 Tax=Neolewinella persica TaxID=70998 RepID=UPI0003747D1C|nr:hypothetical protein [Neolewinella persica]
MSIFPNIDLIGQPEYAEALRKLSPNAVAGVDTLVVYDTDLAFLSRVLNAAGYDDPALQLHLLGWSPDQGDIDMAGLVRHLKIRKVMLFGQELKGLGLHFNVADYFPVEVSGCTYLVCPSAETIATAKANGDNGPAGALWRAVKAQFMNPQ